MALVEAAKRLYGLVTSKRDDRDTISKEMKETFGEGAFYILFENDQEAEAFSRRPRIDERVFYHDTDRCKALGASDAIVGVLAGGRAAALVIVDRMTPGARAHNDSFGNFSETAMEITKVGVIPLESGVPDGVAARVEAAVRVEATKTPRPGQSLWFVQEERGGPNEFVIEYVAKDDAMAAIEELCRSFETDPGATMTLLRSLLNDCTDRHAVIWFRSADSQDTAWIITFSSE